MNIGIIVPSLEEKGPVIVAYNIAKYSKVKNIKYTFISLRKNSNSNKNKYIKAGFTVLEIGMSKIPTFKDLKNLKKCIRDLNLDLIHVHSFWPTLLAAKIPYIKKIVTIHNNPKDDFLSEYGYILGSIMFYSSIKFTKKYDHIVAVSKFVQDKHVSYGLEEHKISVIYNGIEDVFIKKDYPNYAQLKIVSVSVLNKIKNVQKSIEIVEHGLKNNIDIQYTIIGDGKEKSNLQEYIDKNNLGSNITILGEKKRTEVFDYIRKSDLLIVTSNSEGLGLGVLESMMLGTPSIVNNIPVMNEIIEKRENGFIASSHKDYIDELHYIIKNNQLEMVASKAREKYISYFTVEKMSREYVNLYTSYCK